MKEHTCPKCGSKKYNFTRKKDSIIWKCKDCKYKRVKKSAQKLIEEIPNTPKQRSIDRQIRKAQSKGKKKKKPKKKVKAKQLIDILKKDENISVDYNGYENVVKYEDKNICYIYDRNYGIGVSIWDKGGKNWRTIRVTDEKEMKDMVKKLEKKKEK